MGAGMAAPSYVRLQWELRQAFENWTKEYLSGPWDDLIEEMAHVVDDGELTLARATRIDYILRDIRGVQTGPCPTCEVVA